jgi:apolipoprotein D and lipocalin family protein
MSTMRLYAADACVRAAPALLLLAACSATPPNANPRAAEPLQLAPAVDLNRYMGRWYVIANIPYFAERGFVGSYVEYRRLPDGDIDDLYFGRKHSFDAPLERHALRDTVVANSNNAQWRACFFWPLCFAYPIVYVDPDYRYALVGYPDRSWGWVFAREPDIDEVSYRGLLQRFDAQGYDTARFQRVPQKPEQLALPGFQVP